MTKHNLILLLILVIVSNKNSVLAQNSKRPNIIFIMTDDQSSIVPKDSDKEVQSHPFGFNGDSSVHTPIIDGLAKNGMVFNRAYVSSSVCSPSRYTMLTGRYAGRSEGSSFMKQYPYGQQSRVENNIELEINTDNLPKLLQKAGYKTGFVGKSHVIEHELLEKKKNWKNNGLIDYDKKSDPNDSLVSNAMAHNHKQWSRMIKEYGFDYAEGIYAANLRELYNDSLNVHNVEWKNKAALNFIEQNKKEPFFLYYSETVPHGPAPWIKKNGKFVHGLDANPKFTGEGYLDADYSYLPTRDEIKKEIKSLGKEEAQAWLRWFDHAVGAVVDKLKAAGIYENTLIVITSDHGNYNGGKTTLYEGGTKVPLMMHWPAGIKPNSHYNELVQNIDYTPTFLELAGVNLKEVKTKLDGVSLKNVLEGNSKSVHDYLYFELGFARGVATKDWKYITVRYDEKTQNKIDNGVLFKGWNNTEIKMPYYLSNSHLGHQAALYNPFYFEKNQLFDMKTDFLETKNVFEKNKTEANEMKNLLAKILKSFPQRPYGEFTN
jgi:arylsulfatase A-like enzyme